MAECGFAALESKFAPLSGSTSCARTTFLFYMNDTRVRIHGNAPNQPQNPTSEGQVAAVKTGSECAENGAASDSIQQDSAPRNFKTYLVKFGLTTSVGLDSNDTFRTGLIQAENLYTAYDRALRSHVPEAFDEHGALPGEWVEYETGSAVRLRFELDDDRSKVDAGSVLWIEKIVEIQANDVATMEAYLQDW